MELETFRLVHRRQIDRFLVSCLSRRGLRIDVANQRQLRKKFVHVLELAGENCELIEVFAAQFVVRKVHFGVVIVNRFHNRCDHLGRRIRFPAGRDLIQGMRQLRPHFLRFRGNVHRYEAFTEAIAGVGTVAGVADPGRD